MKKHTKSYIAGLFDGEGTVTLTRIHSSDKFRVPVASMTSTSIEILNFIQIYYGGSISKQKVYKEHHKLSWVWRITNQKALLFFKDILPFILIEEKQRRVKLLLNNYNKLTKRNGKYTNEEIEHKLDFENKFFHLTETMTI